MLLAAPCRSACKGVSFFTSSWQLGRTAQFPTSRDHLHGQTSHSKSFHIRLGSSNQQKHRFLLSSDERAVFLHERVPRRTDERDRLEDRPQQLQLVRARARIREAAEEGLRGVGMNAPLKRRLDMSSEKGSGIQRSGHPTYPHKGHFESK